MNSQTYYLIKETTPQIVEALGFDNYANILRESDPMDKHTQIVFKKLSVRNKELSELFFWVNASIWSEEQDFALDKASSIANSLLERIRIHLN